MKSLSVFYNGHDYTSKLAGVYSSKYADNHETCTLKCPLVRHNDHSPLLEATDLKSTVRSSVGAAILTYITCRLNIRYFHDAFKVIKRIIGNVAAATDDDDDDNDDDEVGDKTNCRLLLHRLVQK